MNRRKFVSAALLTGTAVSGIIPLGTTAFAGPEDKDKKDHKDSKQPENKKKPMQQWYELRTYIFANAGQRRITEEYLEKAALPAFNRAGSAAVGIFTEMQPQGEAKMFVLIPFESIGLFTAFEAKLAADTVYNTAGAAYLSADPANPAYDRIESSLLKAFKHMPLLEAPEKKERMFELRCYESPSEAAGQKKIEMFNDAGEIDIFKKIGARPLFFSETIVGARRPNLTYMLCFDNMEDHDARWKAFRDDPDWKKISQLPEYSNAKLISKINSTFLTPASYSQL